MKKGICSSESIPGPNMKLQANNPVQKRLTAQKLAEALGGTKSGDGYLCCCPAHDDKTPSFSVSEKAGKVLFKCFSGCSQEAVINALEARGLWQTTSMNPSSTKPRKKKWDQLSDKEKNGRLWKLAKYSTKPALGYFNTTRGIEIDAKGLGKCIRVSRYKNKKTGKFDTSIVCAVTKPSDKKVEALHRTFLDGEEKINTRMKGRCSGRGVYFDFYDHSEMIIGEGIETTLSRELRYYK